MLLAVLLLASMVFYIFNVGRHVQQRVETQNSADAAAISAAGWVARSFNTVAMNNVEMARLIALAGVLDAVPQAVAHTLADQEAVMTGIERQLRHGVRDHPWVEDGLQEAQANIQRQLELLQGMDLFFNQSGYDVATMTAYKGPEGQRGHIWEALESLAALSEASLENLGSLAQYSAFRGAQINMREAGRASGGLMLPWQYKIPWETSNFDAFRDPVVDGLLPRGQDDKEFNRGPFDVLFGWRNRTYRAIRENIDYGDVERDYANNSWVPPAPTQRTVRREATGYSTWGTYTNMRALGMQLGVGPGGISNRYYPAPESFSENRPLAPSLWARRLGFIADRKINFAFPGAASNSVVIEPQWITDFDGAIAIEAAGVPEIRYGLYLVFTYLQENYPPLRGPQQLQEWGLTRPEDDVFAPPGLEKIDDHVWLDQRIENAQDAGGNLVQRVYSRYYVFVGVNTGQEAAVRNPYNFDAEDRTIIPGPYNFEVGEVTPDNESRAKHFRFLGVAHQPKAAAFWPEAFDADRADDTLVGLAEAEVFNNHSWDLWTQMWHAQLRPVRSYDGWVKEMEEPAGLTDLPFLEEEQIKKVAAYLKAVAPLAEVMLEH